MLLVGKQGQSRCTPWVGASVLQAAGHTSWPCTGVGQPVCRFLLDTAGQEALAQGLGVLGIAGVGTAADVPLPRLPLLVYEPSQCARLQRRSQL